ncbi:MAG: MFS transporter [Pseudomonadota bacterium]
MFYGWYVVGASCLIALYFNGCISLGFTALFEPIAREFGWSYAQVSFAASLRGLEVGLLVPVTGMIMDRWGPRRLVFGGAFLSGLGLILLGRINSLGTFYAAFIVIAMGVSTSTTAMMMVAVANWFRKKAGLAMGITAAGVSFGGLLIPLVTGIVDTFGWRQAVVIMGLGMWVVPLPLSLFLRHKPEQYGCLPDGEPFGPVRGGDQSIPEKSDEVSVRTKEALSSWPFWVIAIAFLFQGLPVSAVMTHIMPYLSSIGTERATSSLIASSLPLMTIVGRVGFGWLGDRVEKRGVAALAFALTSLGVLILGYTGTGRIWVIVAFIIVFGIGWGGSVPMMNGLLRAYFGRERLGTIVGVCGSFLMVGMMIGAPLAGWVFDTWGRYQPVWFFFAGVVGIATILFYVCLGRRPE